MATQENAKYFKHSPKESVISLVPESKSNGRLKSLHEKDHLKKLAIKSNTYLYFFT